MRPVPVVTHYVAGIDKQVGFPFVGAAGAAEAIKRLTRG